MSRKHLLLCTFITSIFCLVACGNKEYFTPTIAVEQVLDNIAKASGKASAADAIDIEAFSETTDTLTAEVGSSIDTDAIVIPQGIKSETSGFSNSQDSGKVEFDSTVVVPEEKQASLLSRLLNIIVKPKENKNNTSTSTTTTTAANTNKNNKNSKNKDTTTTTSPTTPSVEEKTPAVTETPDKSEETVTPKQDEDTIVNKDVSKDEEDKLPTEEVAPTPETPAEEETVPPAEDVVETPVEDETPETIIPITVLIINECGADATVVSVINPKTNEQVNLGTLGIDEMFILKMDWPSKTKNFRIAVYGADGNIVMQKALDFTGITESAAVILSGMGSLEDFTFEVE